MRTLLHRIACWLTRKIAQAAVRMSGSGRASFIEAYRRLRSPSGLDLLAELKNTAYACASLNASVCASYPPRLYVSTQPGQPEPRCLTRRLGISEKKALGRKTTEQVEEVLDH